MPNLTVARVEQFRPRLSSSDSLTPKTHPRIKQQIAGCHTAEVTSIRKYLPHFGSQGNNRWYRSQPCVVGPPPSFVWTFYPSHRLTVLCFLISLALGNGGARSINFGSANSFKHQRQRAQATYMPIKSNEDIHVKQWNKIKSLYNREIKWQLYNGSVKL